MSQNKWDDDKIEDLLSSVPKIKDNRTKDDILQRLKDDGAFDDEPSENIATIKKKRNWIPPLITVAAIAMIALMIPSLMNQLNGENEEIASTSMEMKKDTSDMRALTNESAETEEMGIMADTSVMISRSAVYPEDLEGNTVFHIGLASDAAESIPFTILIPNDQVMADLGKAKPTEVELYNYYAPLLDEETLGFYDYHPYKGSISEKGNEVIHTLPAGHGYDVGSGSMGMYTGSLIDTFKTYDEVELLNEDGTPVVFAEVGEKSDPIQLHSQSTQYNYFKYTQGNGSQYLSTNFRESFPTVEEALESMKEEKNEIFKSVILPGVDYTVTVNGDTVVVAFTSEVDLLNFDGVAAMQMIEGMLLTASNFDKQVKFENIVQSEWGGFDFTNPLPIPVGPNKLPLIIK